VKLEVALAAWGEDLADAFKEQGELAKYAQHKQQHPDFEQWCNSVTVLENFAKFTAVTTAATWHECRRLFLKDLFDDLEFVAVSPQRLKKLQDGWATKSYSSPGALPPSAGRGSYYLTKDFLCFRYDSDRDYLLQANLHDFFSKLDGVVVDQLDANCVKFVHHKLLVKTGFGTDLCSVLLPAILDTLPNFDFWALFTRFEKSHDYDLHVPLANGVAVNSGFHSNFVAQTAKFFRSLLRWENRQVGYERSYFCKKFWFDLPPANQKKWTTNFCNKHKSDELQTFWRNIASFGNNHQLGFQIVQTLITDHDWFYKWYTNRHKFEKSTFYYALLEHYVINNQTDCDKLLSQVELTDATLFSECDIVEICAKYATPSPLLVSMCRTVLQLFNKQPRTPYFPSIGKIVREHAA